MSSYDDLEKGDVVRLRSDYTEMTVRGINEDGTVECNWIPDADPSLKSGTFHPEQLEEADEEISSAGDFERGDVVKLCSGGPQMTVRHVKSPEEVERENGPIECNWISKDDPSLKSASFEPEQLGKIPEAPLTFASQEDQRLDEQAESLEKPKSDE